MKNLVVVVCALTASLVFAPTVGIAAQQEQKPRASANCIAGFDVMAFEYEAFDEQGQAWRALSARGCRAEAAEALNAYQRVHAAQLRADETRVLQWHEGQMLASAGDYASAIRIFEQVIVGDGEPMDRLYTEATLAFLRRDRSSLEDARRSLAALPEPAAFARAADRFAADYKLPRPTWPPNLDVVDKLLRCFNQPYADAYASCPMEQ